ncbi:MAG: 4-hydroxy-3-methylbut-2-enyl diphosphate reductase [Bacteroidota bacterium]
MDQAKPVIEIDPTAGFCSGVKRAIESAEHLLDEAGELLCLGEIVHNEAEMDRLKLKGLKAIAPDGVKDAGKGSRVLIRAHGVPPSAYNALEEKQVLVTDATCPVVIRLQHKVKQASAEMLGVDGSVIIYGKPGHAEVIGLMGNTSGNAMVISSIDEIDRIDFTKPLRIFAQTTSDITGYKEICDTILSLIRNAGTNNPDIKIHQTICGQVSRRNPALKKFALLHDVIIFVSGSGSSNGQYLYSVSKTVNPRTYIVSGSGQLLPEWLNGALSIGISGATSTPVWLMQQIASEIEEMILSRKNVP